MQSETAGVYFSGQDFSAEPPAFFVERGIARHWLDEGKAWSIHHGRDIALSPEAQKQMVAEAEDEKVPRPKPAEESCVMGERVMDANAEQVLWARRMVRAWNWRVARAEHRRSLDKKRLRKIAPSS